MKKRLLILILGMILLMQGCMTSNPFKEEPTTVTTTADTPINPQPTPTPVDPVAPEYVYYSEGAKQNAPWLTTGGNPLYLLLINKEFNQFGDDRYVPANLVTLDASVVPSNRTIQLEARVARAIYAMFSEMKHDGVSDMLITSGYRSYERQTELYNDYVRREQQTISEAAYAYLGEEKIRDKYLAWGKTALDAEDAREVANYYSAKPGQSEHQTGLCVDITTTGMIQAGTPLDNAFENTDAYRWLSENAYRFGFIMRYKKGTTEQTGYMYEPWHYRFVGRDAAKEIHFGNLTLEQYLVNAT